MEYSLHSSLEFSLPSTLGYLLPLTLEYLLPLNTPFYCNRSRGRALEDCCLLVLKFLIGPVVRKFYVGEQLCLDTLEDEFQWGVCFFYTFYGFGVAGLLP